MQWVVDAISSDDVEYILNIGFISLRLQYWFRLNKDKEPKLELLSNLSETEIIQVQFYLSHET